MSRSSNARRKSRQAKRIRQAASTGTPRERPAPHPASADTADIDQLDGDFLTACTDMVGRSGATDLQVRYSDDEDPVIWFGVATYGARDGAGHRGHLVGADLMPDRALFKLLEQIVDGGRCTHCDRPTGITDTLDDMPADALVCWYAYDPELKTFRRGCEGEAA